ncbi:helix-turn-helix domain-containing protein [Kitasatospora nipponensis]|uniref:Helix-turn-helix domain-containing protein n=1 Tax=Kitasatospora nipponensis TaxID=258049 RepID=A0ABN1WM97_9ACTN
MRVHRTEQVRHFTVLSNTVLQCRQLSYTARGLLADLLSRPDGWREDGRQMADTSPQGRAAIRRALRELTDAGFYRVEKIRMPDGTIRSEAHVFDTPQRPELPGVARPVPGDPTTGRPGAQVKNPEQEPSLPAPRAAEPAGVPAESPSALPDEQLRAAVATLFRVIRPEPRLRLGEAEAVALAPLVARWLERGSTAADLARALLPGLPGTVHSPRAVLRYRLEHKMPPERTTERPPAIQQAECAECRDPVRGSGLCRPCSGLGRRPGRDGSGRDSGGRAVAAAGAARVRAALARPPAATGVARHPRAGGSGSGGGVSGWCWWRSSGTVVPVT